MSECCNNILSKGKIDECSTVIIGVSTQAGEHTIYFRNKGGTTYKAVTVVAMIGDNITFSNSGDLNPNYLYQVQVINPDKTIYTQTIDTVVYDCISVEFENLS